MKTTNLNAASRISDDADQDDVCCFCGHDHEDRHCDLSFCADCLEMSDNCDCEDCNEIDAEEFIALNAA